MPRQCCLPKASAAHVSPHSSSNSLSNDPCVDAFSLKSATLFAARARASATLDGSASTVPNLATISPGCTRGTDARGLFRFMRRAMSCCSARCAHPSACFHRSSAASQCSSARFQQPLLNFSCLAVSLMLESCIFARMAAVTASATSTSSIRSWSALPLRASCRRSLIDAGLCLESLLSTNADKSLRSVNVLPGRVFRFSTSGKGARSRRAGGCIEPCRRPAEGGGDLAEPGRLGESSRGVRGGLERNGNGTRGIASWRTLRAHQSLERNYHP